MSYLVHSMNRYYTYIGKLDSHKCLMMAAMNNKLLLLDLLYQRYTHQFVNHKLNQSETNFQMAYNDIDYR